MLVERFRRRAGAERAHADENPVRPDHRIPAEPDRGFDRDSDRGGADDGLAAVRRLAQQQFERGHRYHPGRDAAPGEFFLRGDGDFDLRARRIQRHPGLALGGDQFIGPVAAQIVGACAGPYRDQVLPRQRQHRGAGGVFERQFRRYYGHALQARGVTGLMLLQILESRLDNVVFRLGFASSRAQARLLVTHGHFIVNDHRTDVPSMNVSVGDVIAVRTGSQDAKYFKELAPLAEARNTPAWLSRDITTLSGSVVRMPERPEIDGNLNEQLIVEYYSR